MEYYLYLRPVCEQDLEIIHSWNINPLIINQFNLPDNKPNSWRDTMEWWQNLGNTLLYVPTVVDKVQSATYWKGRPIGLTWIENIRTEPEIGAFIGDTDYYKSNALVEIYDRTLSIVERKTGVKKASLKVPRNQSLIDILQKYGWVVDCEVDGMVECNYGTVAVQST